MKKIFSLILAFTLIFTCSANAFADEVTAERSIVEEDMTAEETQTVQDAADENSAEVQEPSVEDTADVSDSSVEDNTEVQDSSIEGAVEVQEQPDENIADVQEPSAEDMTEAQPTAENSAENTAEELKTVGQKLTEAKEITALPFSETVNITKDDTYTDSGNTQYGKFYKVSLDQGNLIRVNFYGNEDTALEVYKYNGKNYEPVSRQDYDDLPFGGEMLELYVEAEGEYYFVARGLRENSGAFTFEVENAEYGEAVEWNDVQDKAQSVSELPFETTFQLGGPSGKIVVLSGGSFASFEAYKFYLNKDECINFKFDDSSEEAPYICYMMNQGTYVSEMYFSSDYADGNAAIFSAPEDGEYTLFIAGRGISDTSDHTLSINKASYASVDELLNSAYDIGESGSYSEEIVFDSSMLYAPDKNVNSQFYYAKAYKAKLTETDSLYIDLYGYDGINTAIAVYEKNGETYDLIDLYDNDNLMNHGESVVFSPGETGEYYFIARTFSQTEGNVILDVSFNESLADQHTGLDFTADPAPVPQDGDPWSWDAASKTLTLKDGFSVDAYFECGIKLPDGAVIVIEPGAAVDISSASMHAISGVGSLTINMGAGSSLNVNAYDDDAVYAEDSLVITGSKNDRPVIKGYARDDNLNPEYGDLTLSDLELDFNSRSDGFYIGGALNVTSCSIKIRCQDQGIDVNNNLVENCKAVITDSTLDIESEYEEAIRAHDLSLINCDAVISSPTHDGISCLLDENMNGGTFVCKGGSLKADVYWNAVYAEGSIEMSDVKLDLSSGNYDVIYCTAKQPVLDASNTYNVYSAGGNVYTGYLQIVISYSDGRFVANDGSPIVKIVPVDTEMPEDPDQDKPGGDEDTQTPGGDDTQKPGGDEEQDKPGGDEKPQTPDKDNDQKPDSGKDSGKDDSGKVTSPQTGDVSDILLPVMLIAVCGIAAAIAKRKF